MNRPSARRKNIAMKRFLVFAGLLIVAVAATAQSAAPKAPPKSPPATASVTIHGKTIAIDYSSPRVKGRAGHIFTKDGVISHDPTYPVWRAGANTATALHTDAELNIGGRTVPAGNYSLYVDISNPDEWVLIVNRQTGQWGTKYDQGQDLGRIRMKMVKPHELVENLTFTLADRGGNKATLTLAWEDKSGVVPIIVE
jgi:hypothetical protein